MRLCVLSTHAQGVHEVEARERHELADANLQDVKSRQKIVGICLCHAVRECESACGCQEQASRGC